MVFVPRLLRGTIIALGPPSSGPHTVALGPRPRSSGDLSSGPGNMTLTTLGSMLPLMFPQFSLTMETPMTPLHCAATLAVKMAGDIDLDCQKRVCQSERRNYGYR